MEKYFETDYCSIYNEDCLDVMEYLINKKNKLDAIITDPPYLINYKTNHRKYNDKFCEEIKNDDKEKNNKIIIEFIKKSYLLLKENSVMCMFCSFDNIDFFKSEIEKVGFNVKNIIIWVKNNWTAGDLKAQFGKQYEMIIVAHKGRCLFKNDYRYTDVWNFDRVYSETAYHQNQKPEPLIERLIDVFTKKDDIVFDGFAGSFTTNVVCEQLGRKSVGCELESKYCDVGIKRLKNIQTRLELF